MVTIRTEEAGQAVIQQVPEPSGEARDFYVYAVLREAPTSSAPGEPGR